MEKYYSAYTGLNSFGVFERNRVNEFGERYCIASGLTQDQASKIAELINSGKMNPENTNIPNLDSLILRDHLI